MTSDDDRLADTTLQGAARPEIGALTPPPWSEDDRPAALDLYRILDTPREPQFDDVARLAADIFDAPIAVVNLIAESA